MAVDDVLDLDARREQRLKARAARRGQQGETLPVRFGGEVISTVKAELPLDALAPLLDIDVDLPTLIHYVLEASKQPDQAQASIEMIVSVLAVNPNLPRSIVEAAHEIGRRVLGVEGYEAFVAKRPSPWDVGALISGLLSWWGLNLGELLRSSPSSPDGGETSKPASPGSTPASTSAESGGVPASPASSVSGA